MHKVSSALLEYAAWKGWWQWRVAGGKRHAGFQGSGPVRMMG